LRLRPVSGRNGVHFIEQLPGARPCEGKNETLSSKLRSAPEQTGFISMMLRMGLFARFTAYHDLGVLADESMHRIAESNDPHREWSPFGDLSDYVIAIIEGHE